MIYKNRKTGASFDSPCKITGGDWEEVKAEVAEEPEEEIRLSELTVSKLIDLAEELEIDLGDATKKDDIIAVILEAEESSAE